MRSLLEVACVAALIGPGAALAVDRAIGVGQKTVVQHEVVQSNSISDPGIDIPVVLAKVLPAVVSVQATSSRSNPFFGRSLGSQVSVAQGTGVIVPRAGGS